MENLLISNECGCSAQKSQLVVRAIGEPGRRVAAFFNRIDKTWLFIGLVFLAIAIGIPSHLLDSILFAANNLWGIAPFLLLSASISGYLEAAGADRLVGKVFSDRVVLAIVAAAIFGALSPFCSCGVIPLIAALLAARVPLATTLTLWKSS